MIYLESGHVAAAVQRRCTPSLTRTLEIAMMRRLKPILRYLGLVSLSISALPWLGLGGGFSFAIPGYDIVPPRLHLLDRYQELYDFLAVPLHGIAVIPPLDLAVFFISSRGIVRPFNVFLFWSFLGNWCLWASQKNRLTEKRGAATFDRAQ